MSSIAGLKQIGLCDAGTLATAPANALALGYRGNTPLKITPFKNQTDYLDRSLRNKLNFNISGESFQGTMEMLSKLHGWLNLNADIQIITNKQSASANSEDVFKFVGNNKLGIGFEYIINDDKRSITPTFEGALEYDSAKTLIDSADSETAVDLGFGTREGINKDYYNYPFMLAVEAPKTTALFTKADILAREFKLSVQGAQDAYNKLVAHYLALELSITGKEASITKIVEMLNKEMTSSILWKEQNGADPSIYDAFDINTGVLNQTEEITIDDEQRIVMVKYAGKIPIYETEFLFGDGNGGVVDDNAGATGGTLKIGY